MLKWLKELVGKIGKSKFWVFLIELFRGTTGDFLDNNHEEINESVKVVEEIAKFLFDNKAKSYQELKDHILNNFKISISIDEMRTIYLEKSTGKFALAYKNSSEKIKANGKDFNEELMKSALSLGIEMAVNRFFGK